MSIQVGGRQKHFCAKCKRRILDGEMYNAIVRKAEEGACLEHSVCPPRGKRGALGTQAKRQFQVTTKAAEALKEKQRVEGLERLIQSYQGFLAGMPEELRQRDGEGLRKLIAQAESEIGNHVKV